MSMIAVLAVYNEEKLLHDALASLRYKGIDSVHIFDGAWQGFGDTAESSDRTFEIAERATRLYWQNSRTHWRVEPWESQEQKRTYMFHNCGAVYGDHVFVFDADERLEGRFPILCTGRNYNVNVKCVGPNDMPGIRGEWPLGDYFADYKPELRVFAYDPELVCRWPGGYWNSQGRIEPYVGTKSALPVVEGVSFTHHGGEREPERIKAKIAYYEREHPERERRQKAEWSQNPW